MTVKSNQHGEGAILLVVAFAALIFLGFMIYTGVHSQSQYNGWVNACEAHGGIVRDVAVINSHQTWDDCFVNGKVYIVPGYEWAQKGRPANLDPSL